MLAASTGWLLAGLVYDALAVSRDIDPDTLTRQVRELVPWLLTGFVIQVLLGALSYLIPILLGGPPSIGRRTTAAANRWGFVSMALLNAGAALLAVGRFTPRYMGWLFVAVAIGVFAWSVASATAVRARATIAP
jgi:nitrite reductase (NO-forming)